MELYLILLSLKNIKKNSLPFIKQKMDNIFTFEIDDFEEDVEIEESEKIQQKTKSEILKQNAKKLASQPFVFQEFDENEDEQPVRDIQKKGPYQLSQNETEIKKQKYRPIRARKHIGKENQNEENSSSSKSQLTKTGSMLAGLHIQDLGTNDMEYVCEKKALKVTDLRKFLHTPLGDYKVKAIIKKEGSGILSINNKYNVYIEQNNRYLFTIARQGISEYIFSLDKNNISDKKKNYLGRMVGNMSGTQFLLFDSGFSPKETRSLEHCRKQLASIKYSSSTGPRKFTTIVSTNCQGFYALQPDQNILQQKWQKKQRQYLSILHSKSPQYDPQDGNYKLDFKGIVKKASVKNFILGGVEWQDSLIFGKIGDETFIMQIKQPLSVMQAAAVCISSIHYKLHWR